MQPIVNRLREEYGDQIVFARYDIDAPASAEFEDKYRITGVPTFVVLNARQEEISRISGGFGYSDMKQKLEKYVTE
jgi:thiol-disulfide isomerase/thioredoxin